LERGDLMQAIEIVPKRAEPVRMATTTGIAAGYGHDNIGPVFQERLPIVWQHLIEAGVEPGICVASYEWPDDDGRVVVHLGFDIGAQTLPDGDDVRVIELASVEVASALHQGAFNGISDTFDAIIRWIDDNGYRIADRSRELYLETNLDNTAKNVMELQIPITR
jgi:GyrI-like small molecule binding domain